MKLIKPVFSLFAILSISILTLAFLPANQTNEMTIYEIEEIDYPATTFATVRADVKMTDITKFYAENLPKLAGSLAANMVGMPCGLYYSFGETSIDMAAAIAVKPGTNIPEEFQTVELSATKALQMKFYGNYSDLGKGHDAMEEYMNERSLTQKEPIIEQYITDPSTEPDPSKWLTLITYFYE